MDAGVRAGPGYHWCLLLGLAVSIYCVTNLLLPILPVSGFIQSYVIQPILWASLAGAVHASPGYRPAARLRVRNGIIQFALLVGFFQTLLYVIGGLFSGFGRSPHSLTPVGIVTNLFFVGLKLAGMELSRAWLINCLGRHHTFLALAFVAVVYALLGMPLAQITGLRPAVESVPFLNSSLLPLLAESLLATSLALSAGPLASISYRGMLQAFWWFCPVLPDLSWILKGLIGISVPVVGLVVVENFYAGQTIRARQRRRAEASSFPAGWVITALVAVVIVWFAVGLFPFHAALVGSGSMRPAMDAGDIAIIAKTQADAIKLGDIIQFQKADEATVLHRVVSSQGAGQARVFTTKGDANDEPDRDPVAAADVAGRVAFTVPKIGWVAILAKQILTR